MTDIFRIPLSAQRQIVKNGTSCRHKTIQGEWLSKKKGQGPRILEVYITSIGNVTTGNPTWKKDSSTGMYYTTQAYVIRRNRGITNRRLKVWSSMEQNYSWEREDDPTTIGNMDNNTTNSYFAMYFHGRWNIIGSWMLPGEIMIRIAYRGQNLPG